MPPTSRLLTTGYFPYCPMASRTASHRHGTSRLGSAGWGFSALSVLWFACACSSPSPPSEPALTIGLLLPFTGSESATASNLEQSAIYAVDRINAGGGVRGLP